MRSEGGARGVLARAGFSVVDELDLEPWHTGELVRARSRPARWVVSDEEGRSGFVVVGYLDLVSGVHEAVDGTSLLDLGERSSTTERFEDLLLRKGASPRPFVSNADVVDLYERLGGRRFELARALADVGPDAHLAWTLWHPESAEPRDRDRLLAVLDELASGVPLEWLVRKLAAGVGA